MKVIGNQVINLPNYFFVNFLDDIIKILNSPFMTTNILLINNLSLGTEKTWLKFM